MPPRGLSSRREGERENSAMRRGVFITFWNFGAASTQLSASFMKYFLVGVTIGSVEACDFEKNRSELWFKEILGFGLRVYWLLASTRGKKKNFFFISDQNSSRVRSHLLEQLNSTVFRVCTGAKNSCLTTSTFTNYPLLQRKIMSKALYLFTQLLRILETTLVSL